MKRPSRFLLVLSLVSLAAIGIVLVNGIFRRAKSQKETKKTEANILGETISIIPTQAASFESFVQGALDNTTNIVSEKFTQVEQTVLKTVEKEITNLTQSQVDNLKLTICRDWGVITIAPTKNP